MQLEQKIAVKMDDGSVKLFDTKAEAMSYLQRPKQTEAFKAFVGDNPDLITWLLDNRSEVESAFESAKIKRVTKSEKNALKKALDAIKAAEDKAFAFVVEHSDAILNSFRWPSVKRMAASKSSKLSPPVRRVCRRSSLLSSFSVLTSTPRSSARARIGCTSRWPQRTPADSDSGV